LAIGKLLDFFQPQKGKQSLKSISSQGDVEMPLGSITEGQASRFDDLLLKDGSSNKSRQESGKKESKSEESTEGSKNNEA